jgi:hypothetical protein
MNRNRELGNPLRSLLKSDLAQNCYMFLLLSLCPVLLYKPAFQNDTYWLINTGKYIVHNGFPKTEPFTIHQGLHFIVQQWLSTILFHESYQMGGAAGVHILIIGVCAMILFLIYRLALQLADGKKLLASYIAAFIGVILSFYMMPRPQVFSLLVFVAEVSFLEYYVRNQERHWAVIFALPLLSALLVNLHSAIWPVFFLLCIPYLIDGFKFRIGGIEGHGYRKGPLFMGLLFSILLGLANPYGFHAMTYLFNSYGNSAINSHVQEMFSPDFKSISGMFIFVVVLAVVFIYLLVRGGTRFRYVLLTVGTLYMGLSSVRSFSLFIIFGLVFLSYYLKAIDLSASMPARRRAILVSIAVLAMSFVRISHIPNVRAIEEDYRPEAAVRYIRSNIDLSKMRIYNSYDTGGYIEFSGIRSFIDSRAEIYTKKLNRKEDIFQDYCDALAGKLYYTDLIAKYSFTHLLVNNDDLMNNCLKNDKKYRVVFHDTKYVIYEKVV